MKLNAEFIGTSAVTFRDGGARTVIDARIDGGDIVRLWPTDVAMPEVDKLAGLPMGTPVELSLTGYSKDGRLAVRLDGVTVARKAA